MSTSVSGRVSLKVGSDLQRRAAAGSPAAGPGDPRGELETRPLLPLYSAGLQPTGSAQPER